MDTNRVLSICIPTWKRTHLVIRAIEKVIDDPRINEIVVVDDASPMDTFFKLEAMLHGMPKIKLFRNGDNLDCYRNKYQALQHASNDWCILFDSDNILYPTYIDAIYSLPDWHPHTFYCPEFARPHFDYTAFSGLYIDKSNVHKHVGTKAFDCLINTANYFVNRSLYCHLFDSDIDPHAADTIFMNTQLLQYGGQMYVVPAMRYFHDVHDESHYKANHHKSDALFKELRETLNSMR